MHFRVPKIQGVARQFPDGQADAEHARRGLKSQAAAKAKGAVVSVGLPDAAVFHVAIVTEAVEIGVLANEQAVFQRENSEEGGKNALLVKAAQQPLSLIHI